MARNRVKAGLAGRSKKERYVFLGGFIRARNFSQFLETFERFLKLNMGNFLAINHSYFNNEELIAIANLCVKKKLCFLLTGAGKEIA